ncbi:Golgi integral membrane protein 4-like isoform X2 [Zootermopsis nevadensis]|uniref:Golgi integral membrane protein 4-like isoform X2 n=1 Tax=Zootermopsis nevadensis TaxID=136037 RepID=UPI000B8E21E0|nr:Golgi integral membrane protein 4-like isoform X2 [Zootermopsis nevadensis]
MSGSRLVRGTRSRLFLYLAVVVVVGMAVYVFHGAQLQLDDARKAADKCQQQQESLSAQLQVIFEYKLRLEKSLQQEKADHRKTHEELEKRTNGEKEANNKHSALQQQYKILQSQHDDLSEDCHKMHLTQAEERSKLESQVLSLQEDLTHAQAGHKKSLNSLKTEYTKLEVENAHLEKQNAELRDQTSKTSKKLNFLEKQNFQLERDLAKATKELKTYQRHPPQTVEKASEGKQDADGSLKSPVRHSNADPSPLPASSVSSLAAAAAAAAPAPENQVNVEEPVLNQDNADNKASGQRSTTPQINPEALLSQERAQQSNNVAPVPPPGQEKHEDGNEKMDPEVPNLPRPAMEDPSNKWKHRPNVPAEAVPGLQGHVYHQNAQAMAPNKNVESRVADRWSWPRFQFMPQPIAANVRENNPLDDNGPEDEEEEVDPAHPHRRG